MGQAMAPGLAGATGAAPAAAAGAAIGGAGAAPTPAESPEDRLGKLKGLLERGLITQADFDGAKAEILKKLIG
jgi:membrane protease subunit (stomatin/prohibitin family)